MAHCCHRYERGENYSDVKSVVSGWSLHSTSPRRRSILAQLSTAESMDRKRCEEHRSTSHFGEMFQGFHFFPAGHPSHRYNYQTSANLYYRERDAKEIEHVRTYKIGADHQD